MLDEECSWSKACDLLPSSLRMCGGRSVVWSSERCSVRPPNHCVDETTTVCTTPRDSTCRTEVHAGQTRHLHTTQQADSRSMDGSLTGHRYTAGALQGKYHWSDPRKMTADHKCTTSILSINSLPIVVWMQQLGALRRYHVTLHCSLSLQCRLGRPYLVPPPPDACHDTTICY